MEVVKNNGIIIIKEDSILIEEYNFDTEITFSKLFEYLLNLNFSKKVEFDVNLKSDKDEEKNLINLLKEIIDIYNKKVDEFNNFKSNNGQGK